MNTLTSLFIVVCFTALAAGARGAEPPTVTYVPAPPGTIAQSSLVYLAGEAMHSQWRAILSKKKVGTADNGDAFYQWDLSIYALDGTTYRLKYKSPGNGGPLSTVAKAHGANLWFPLQSAKIVGAAEFMQPTVQEVVIQSHESAADCGASTVTVLAYDPQSDSVVPSVTVTNGCDLNAAIVGTRNARAIALTGPYYGPNAAMCCPTKPKARATLRFTNGKWTEKPSYFPIKTRVRT